MKRNSDLLSVQIVNYNFIINKLYSNQHLKYGRARVEIYYPVTSAYYIHKFTYFKIVFHWT